MLTRTVAEGGSGRISGRNALCVPQALLREHNRHKG